MSRIHNNLDWRHSQQLCHCFCINKLWRKSLGTSNSTNDHLFRWKITRLGSKHQKGTPIFQDATNSLLAQRINWRFLRLGLEPKRLLVTMMGNSHLIRSSKSVQSTGRSRLWSFRQKTFGTQTSQRNDAVQGENCVRDQRRWNSALCKQSDEQQITTGF